MRDQRLPDLSGELDLVDLWLIVKRHRRMFLSVLAAVFAIGCITALLKTPKYYYTVAMQIGGMRTATGVDFIEKPNSLKAEIENSYLPQVLAKYNKSNSGNWAGDKIKVTVPENGNVIVLQATGSKKQAAAIEDILNALVTIVAGEHNRLLQTRVSELRTLVTGQAAELKTRLSAELQQRDTVAKQGNFADKAMTLLLLNNQISQDESRLADLNEQLKVGLTSDVRYTQAVSAPQRLPEPVGLGRAAIIAISAILGLLFGGVAVMVMRLMEAARQRAAAYGEVIHDISPNSVKPDFVPDMPAKSKSFTNSVASK